MITRPRRSKLLARRSLLRSMALAAPVLILPCKGKAWRHGAYVIPPPPPNAAHFDGLATQISIPLPFIGGSNTGKFIASWWMANTIAGADSNHSDILLFCSYPIGLVTIGSNGNIFFPPSKFIADFYDSTASFNLEEIQSDDTIYPLTPWTHIAVNVDLEHADPDKIMQYYVNGAPASFTNAFSYAPSLIVSLNEESFMYFGANGFGSYCQFDLADLQLWAGVSTDLAVTIIKLISGGHPVNPAIAAAAFGPQTVLFSGDRTTFPLNQGTGGIATLVGPLTDASTNP
jgi:hypothetical protein